jgi:flagellar L-ring protein FlgH
MIRFTALVVALYAICCAIAWGDPAAPGDNVPPERPAAPQVAGERRDGPLVVPHSGSLVKNTVARMRAGEDPDRVKYSDLSIMAVPQEKPRVIKKHDLVTIIVREESQSSSKGTTDLKKSADIDAKIDAYVKLNLKKLSLDAKTPATSPEIKAEFDRNFKGDATVDRTDTLTARIGAEVLDVKPNGTLVLQARKRIKTDEEEQDFILTGVCRAEDVGPDNTVLSNTLNALDVRKGTQGAARDTTKRGWIPRLLDFANPF